MIARWKNRFAAKFFLSYFGIVLLLFVFVYLYSGSVVKNFYVSSLSQHMQQKAELLGRLLPTDLEGEALDTICSRLAQDLRSRITVLALDGKVLGDSDEPSSTMENHRTRSEVVEALSAGAGKSIRYSTTVGYDMLYQAVWQKDSRPGRIIRVSVPLEAVEGVVGSMRRAILTGLLLASAFGLGLAFLFSRQLGSRVNKIATFSQQVALGSDSQASLPGGNTDELGLLENNLREMQRSIEEKIFAMAAEKEKVESILRGMTEGVLAVDKQGKVILVNENAQKMFQLRSSQDLYGASFMEVSRHPEMKGLMEEVLACDCSQECFTKEVVLDEGRWFRVNAVSLTDGKEQPSGYVLVFHDVTELKRLETVRADFVANVSHELRTPLAAIKGYAETLLRNPPSEPATARQFLEVIDRHSERLGRLIDDLLTLSDLESGKLRLAKASVDVDNLTGRVLEIFRVQAQNKNVTLSQAIEPDIRVISGDADRLQQLLINLVDNAVKYTPSGGRVNVSAALVTCSETGIAPMVAIAVSDTGCGIPEKDLPRLTERFYRVDKARSRELGGTGLGLAIVKHIVQAHGGSLKISSRMDKGTTVSVFLPTVLSPNVSQEILYLCTGNSCRSQMAEGFARQVAPADVRIYSAGTEPKQIHPLAIEVMREVGIDISAQKAKGLEAVPLDQIDLLVTLCGEAAESCPTLPRNTERRHWPIPDPALARGDKEAVLNTFREARDEIRRRIKEMFRPGT